MLSLEHSHKGWCVNLRRRTSKFQTPSQHAPGNSTPSLTSPVCLHKHQKLQRHSNVLQTHPRDVQQTFSLLVFPRQTLLQLRSMEHPDMTSLFPKPRQRRMRSRQHIPASPDRRPTVRGTDTWWALQLTVHGLIIVTVILMFDRIAGQGTAS